MFVVQVTKSEEDEGPGSGHAELLIQRELQELVCEFTPSVFRDELPPSLPPDRGIDPVIKLPSGTKPPFGPLYRMSPRELETLKRQIADLLTKGHIVPSTAAFGATCLFATKKDSDELRLVVDYCKLNALSLPNRGTLPRIDDMYTAVRGGRIFSVDGVSDVRLPPRALVRRRRPLTSFQTPLGLFAFAFASRCSRSGCEKHLKLFNL